MGLNSDPVGAASSDVNREAKGDKKKVSTGKTGNERTE